MVRESAFAQLAAELVWQRHHSDPVAATVAGVHDYDDRLTDLTADGFAAREALADRWLARLENLDPYSLTLVDRMDRALLIAQLKGERALRAFERPRRQPSLYSDAVVHGAYYAVIREQPAPEERLRRLVERLAAAPAALAAGRARLDPGLVPTAFAEVAARSAVSGAAFLRTLAARVHDDEGLRADLDRAATEAAAALDAYAAWCRDDLAPVASGSFAIGRETFDELLRDRELTDHTADTLLAFGEELARETEAKLAESAKALGDASWREAVARLREDHPATEELVEAYRREMERSRNVTVASGIFSLPASQSLEVEATPEFLRPTYPYAGYLGPAPFGTAATGRFWVTPSDDPEALAGHPRAGLPVVACHEGYPGHHLQMVSALAHPSSARKAFRSSAFVEGWGLYVEELMADLGFFAKPETQLLRLRDLLWRAVRVSVDVGLATGTMGFDEAVAALVDRAALERPNAVAEVRRYVLDPLQPSSYALGRAAFLKMRGRARERGWGMKEFHDRLLALGAIPPSLAEEELF